MTESTMSMVPTEQARVFVHLLPKLIPPGSLRGGVAVVVDVLRATTVMVQALAAGCEAIIPCGEIDEAMKVAAGLPAGTALLAGERQGLPIPGFDLGNSPGEFTPDVCRDKTLVMTTTNGTRAILASLEAERVYIASFTNLRATSDEISVQFLKKDHGHSVHIVCAGTEGHISLEDSLLAGALTSQIAKVCRSRARLRKSHPSSAMTRLSWWWPNGSKSNDFSKSVRCGSCSAWGVVAKMCLRIGRKSISKTRPISTGTIWSPSCNATRCESWPCDAGNRGNSGWALPRSCPEER